MIMTDLRVKKYGYSKKCFQAKIFMSIRAIMPAFEVFMT